MSLSDILLWMHLVSAISWIGGMVFLSLVLAPLVRFRKAAPEIMALFNSAARRFRAVVWGAIAVLSSTGPILLHQRGFSIVNPDQWPPVLRIKIWLVIVLLVLTFAHDLLSGSAIRTIGAIPGRARSPWQQALVRLSAWLPRAALFVALGVVAAALMLTRS